MKLHIRNALTYSALLALAHLGPLQATAQEDAPEVDAKVTELVKQMSEHLKGLDSFELNLTSAIKMTAEGMKQEMTFSYEIALDRPNRFAMKRTRGMAGVTLVSDGTKVYTHVPALGKYSVEDAPEKISKLSDNMGLNMMSMSMGGGPFIQTLIADDAMATMMDGVDKAEYIGREDLDGTATHHLKFYQEAFDWEAWIQADGAPVLRQIKPDMSKTFENMGEHMPGMMKNMKMDFSIRFDDWTFNPELDDTTFAFEPPEGAKKVDSLFGGGFGGGNDEETEHSLLNEPAPDFTLDLLEGGAVKLSQHKDKDVVILDFWATWCGPCVRALPELIKVADTYKDKNVVFYAVNQREKPGLIRSFLEKKEMELTVALDTKGEIGKSYGVRGIPQTVIVGKDGIVKAVHVGFSPGLERKLSAELDTILAGGEEETPDSRTRRSGSGTKG